MDIRASSNNRVDLNGMADAALEEFAAFGRYLDSDIGQKQTEEFRNLVNLPGVSHATNEVINHGIEQLGELENASAAKRLLSVVAKMVEGFTGVGEMAKTFARERDSGSRMYPQTAMKSVEMTARITAATIAGGAAAAGLSAVGLGVAAPVLLGGVVAYGAAKAVQSGFEWLRA